MKQDVSQPLLLTIKDVQRELGLGRSKVEQLMKQEGLPFVRFGRAVRIYKHSLEQWVKEREQQSLYV